MSASKKIEKSHPGFGLGSFIRQKRAESGLTLKEVAAYLDVSLETLGRYEENKKQIPLNHIYALSNCLNISAELILRLVNAR